MQVDLGYPDLGETFLRLFSIAPALDVADIAEVLRIRHEVYCRDLKWELPRDDGQESDEYDRHSIHWLLRRRDTGESVGCARLIFRRPEDPYYPLPFEKSCADAIDRNIADPTSLRRDTFGEVSRLAVLSAFRQRKGEANVPIAIGSDDYEARSRIARFPFITVSLFFGAAVVARRFGIEHVFVLTEPRLSDHFKRIGFDIHAVGKPIEHHGTRIPSVLSSSKVLVSLRPRIRPLFDVIEPDFNDAFDTRPMTLNWIAASTCKLREGEHIYGTDAAD
jgi:N-acyl amino acid synthase of PEP-CTERM/exosortase system